jgi:ferrous iron transport protein B
MLKSLMIHMWDRSKMFIKRMGGVILVGSIIVWGLANFPRYGAIPGAYSEQPSVQTHLKESPAGVAGPQQTAGSQLDLERLAKARQAEYSFLGRLGRGLVPVFHPLGIDWRGGVALLSGFVAKEIVVSTLGVLYAVTDDPQANALQSALRAAGMTPLAALSMMVFVLLYLPCLATVTTIRRETGSVGWMLFSITYSTSLAWVMAFVVYQGGQLLGWG